MNARMKNPAFLIPGALQALQALPALIEKGGVPPLTLHLIHLRASQINGCSFCVDIGTKFARKQGETDDRLCAVAAWHDSPLFTDAERAALALAEAMTRLADRTDPVPDAVWAEVEKHYDERGRAGLVLSIATTNAFNRINVTTKQVAGEWAAA